MIEVGACTVGTSRAEEVAEGNGVDTGERESEERECICGCLGLPLIILTPYFFSNIKITPLNSLATPAAVLSERG